MAGVVTITVHSKKLVAELHKGWKHFAEKEMRGVVSKAVNAIRDQAEQNAIAVGLGQTGPVVYAGGGRHNRRGKIPGEIYSWVMTNAGEMVPGRISVDTRASRGPSQTFHAFFLEHGTRNMAAKPFFNRALAEASGKAFGDAQTRFDQGVKRILK